MRRKVEECASNRAKISIFYPHTYGCAHINSNTRAIIKGKTLPSSKTLSSVICDAVIFIMARDIMHYKALYASKDAHCTLPLIILILTANLKTLSHVTLFVCLYSIVHAKNSITYAYACQCPLVS